MTDFSIPRDQWGRPLLYPPEGGRRVGYSRPSTLAKDLDKINDGLVQYHQTNAMVGLAINNNLMRRVKGIIARGGNWDTAKGDFKDIAKTAEVIGGSTNKADRGTSIHDFCGAIEDDTLDWSLVDEELKGPLDGYYEFVVSSPRVEFLAREVFLQANIPLKLPTGNQMTLRSAGSADRIMTLDGERKMADIKTGKDKDFRMGVTGQLALYVEGQLYQDPGVQQNVPWAEYFPNADGSAEFADHECDYDEGIMLWCPQGPNGKGKWEWEILRVPLERGRQIVRCGQWARKLRTIKEFERVTV